MIQAIGLSKSYPNHVALHPLDLEVQPGEIFCLLGANGAGKTTTIHLFLGFLKPTAGTAAIGGLDVSRYPPESKRLLAYIPEQVNLYPSLTGAENLEYFSSLAGTRHSPAQLLSLLQQSGLTPKQADQRVATYSKGMRQKIGIAIALAKNARALLLDEPTSGLDPQASNEFSTLLKQLSAGGAAILMATHDLFHAKATGTRIGIMKHGRLAATYTAAELDHAGLERIYLDHMRDPTATP